MAALSAPLATVWGVPPVSSCTVMVAPSLSVAVGRTVTLVISWSMTAV